MVHIDSLSVSELHPEGCPDFGELQVMRSFLETGEIVSNTLSGHQVEGSWAVSLRVRCVGGRVEVSGNPSKWGRLDAVTGLTSVSDALDVYDQVLLSLGLPKFSRTCGKTRLRSGDFVKTGPQISRIDLTRNIVTGGKGQAAHFMVFCGSYSWGRLKPIFRGAESVTWGNRGRRQLKMYRKADEIRSHRGDLLRKIEPEKREYARDYLDRLSDWADELGLVREEVELGRRVLFDNEWTAVDSWDGIDLSERMPTTVRQSVSGGAAVIDWKAEVFDRIEAVTGSPRQARIARDMLLSWMSGADPRDGLSQATFYRYSKLLRDTCSVDVRNGCNVQAISTRVRVVEVEAKELAYDDLPVWYSNVG